MPYAIYAKLGYKVGKKRKWDKKWGRWSARTYKTRKSAENAVRKLMKKQKKSDLVIAKFKIKKVRR